MTDKEIIKALECCNKAVYQNSCEGCSYHHIQGRCTENLLKDTIYLINRQQAEIERLKKKVEELSDVLSDSIRIRY